MNDSLETKLERLFQVDSPVTLAQAVEARVGAAAQAESASSRSRPARRLARSLALALVATLGLAAAGIGALELYERAAYSAPDGDRLAWDRSVDLDLTVETAGGTVTLARGYADGSRVVLTVGSSAPEALGGTELRDADGRFYRPFGGSGYHQANGESVDLQSWLPPEPLSVGDVQLTWSSAQGAAQPWALTFTLPVSAGGIALEPHETVTLDGVSVTLEEFEISPSIVVWTMSIDGLDPDRSWAAASMSLTRNGEDAFAGEFQTGGPQGEDQMQHLHAAMRGIEEPTGEWTLTIGELVGERIDRGDDTDQLRLQGPWEFVLSVP
ncbi:MAG: hypothetical protein WKH68_08635 [Candidatus Limnocylindria bacterium]